MSDNVSQLQPQKKPGLGKRIAAFVLLAVLVAGGVAAVFGLNAAPFVVLMILTNIYEQFCSNLYVVKALSGIRAAVLPIIGSAALRLRKSSLKDAGGWLIMLATFLIGTFTGFSRVLTVVCGALAGLIVMEVRQHGVR